MRSAWQDAAVPNDTEVWLIRHGETEWSRDGLHTSVTDLPLTDVGEAAARELAARLSGVSFDLVLTSPRQRATRTVELAGVTGAQVDEDLAEWAYGEYEGRTTAEIREESPDWSIWTGRTPGGETAEHVAERLDRVIATARARGGRVALFGHGHALRALAARWIGEPVATGRFFKLDTATVSVLGHDRETPVLVRWNA
jgi:probable phosphoglycerate mutase